jgi:predicted nucleic acid-binding protein
VIVLDASAVVDVVVGNDNRLAVLDRLGDRLCAPAHQPAEVLSAIARLVRAGDLTDGNALLALDAADGIDQELVLPSVEHLQAALVWSERIRVVDGIYVALAAERGCPLLTSDARLARAKPPCEVILAR